MNLLLLNLKTDSNDDVLGFTTDWINALAKHYDKIFVITMVAGNICVAKNVEVYSVGKEKNFSEIHRLFNFYRILTSITKRHKIDACFAHMMPLFAVLAWPMLKIMRIPILLWYAHGHVSFMLRLAEKLVNGVVTSSPQGFRINSNKVAYIGQGISIKKIPFRVRGSFTDTINLLYVGRVALVKNIHLLIETISDLNKDLSQSVNLTIVGRPLLEDDMEYEERLINLADKLGVTKKIIWAGSVPHNDIGNYFYNCDIFVNPSNTGSIDKTVLEAMAGGTLVVTGNEAFNNAEFIDNGGFYVPNKTEELCKLIKFISTLDDLEIEKRSFKERKWVEENHSLDKLSLKVVENIDRLLNMNK